MFPQSRRAFIRSGTLGILGLSGCIQDGTGGPDPEGGDPTMTDASTPTCEASTGDSQCEAVDPPAPTDAATEPESYPDQPDAFTEQAVTDFVLEFDRAYQFNTALEEYPDMIGRQDQVEVSLEEPTVTAGSDCYVVEVAGQMTVHPEYLGERSTPTRTPFGHVHFWIGGTYVVTERSLRRDDVTYACW